MGLESSTVSDQYQSSLGAAEMFGSFVVDVENVSPCTTQDNPSASSRTSVKLQKILSRKGSQKEKEDRDKTTLSASSAVTGRSSDATLTPGGCSPKKFVPVAVASLNSGTKEFIDRVPHQTITITAENRCNSRKHFKHRTSHIDPRRVLIFFATLSSMGTIILIYFTLSINKFSGDRTTQTQQ